MTMKLSENLYILRVAQTKQAGVPIEMKETQIAEDI